MVAFCSCSAANDTTALATSKPRTSTEKPNADESFHRVAKMTSADDVTRDADVSAMLSQYLPQNETTLGESTLYRAGEEAERKCEEADVSNHVRSDSKRAEAFEDMETQDPNEDMDEGETRDSRAMLKHSTVLYVGRC